MLFSVQAHPEISDYTQCVDFDAFTQEWHRKLYNIFSLCVVYVIPLLIIIICYTGICIKLFANSRCLGNVKGKPLIVYFNHWLQLNQINRSESQLSTRVLLFYWLNFEYNSWRLIKVSNQHLIASGYCLIRSLIQLIIVRNQIRTTHFPLLILELFFSFQKLSKSLSFSQKISNPL